MKPQTTVGRGFTRRKKAFLLMLATAAGIATLLYFEQVAVIYVLATFGLVILLLIVAFADLEKVGQEESGTASENNEKAKAATSGAATEIDKGRRKAA